MSMTIEKLAIDGGKPAISEPLPPTQLGPAEIGEEEVEAVSAAIRKQKLFRFMLGEESKCLELERLFAEMTGCKHALAVGGGTAALICGLVGIGVGDGDEVIIPAYTYIASAAAVLIVGAVPVIAEINESLTIDPDDIEKKITSRTKAIMPVHMVGTPCDMDTIMAVAKKHNLKVIEDVAQACTASYKGKRLGSIGDVGCFSLQQFKLMTAGEGGMIVTNDPEIFQRAAIRHDSAMCYWDPSKTTVGPFPGENFRMNEMEGALGCVQFGRAAGIIAHTRKQAARLRAGIKHCPNLRLHQSPDLDGDLCIQVRMQFNTTDFTKEFAEALAAEGVPCGSAYNQGFPDRHIYKFWEYIMTKSSSDKHGRPWTSPLHDQTRTYSQDMCPRTLDILGRTVGIALSQKYTDAHVDSIIAAVKKVANALA